jgi:cell division protein FtsW (lipid II flippase)
VNPEKTDSKLSDISWLALLMPVPAVLQDVFVMTHSGIKPAVWLVATALCAAVTRMTPLVDWNFRFGFILMLAAAMTLSLTLWRSGLDGVHRWLNFGPVRLYAASIALPAFLIGLGDFQIERDWRTASC